MRHLTVTGIETAARMAATQSATRSGSRINAAPKQPDCTRSEGQPTFRLISSYPNSAPIRAAVASGAPDLVVGDFNATPDHSPMRALADAGYRAVAELANEGWQPTWPANGIFRVHGLPLPRFAPIDHVLVGERLAALGSSTVALDGTDHRAVVAEVARK